MVAGSTGRPTRGLGRPSGTRAPVAAVPAPGLRGRRGTGGCGHRGLRTPGCASPASPPAACAARPGPVSRGRSRGAGTQVKGGQLGFRHLRAAAAPSHGRRGHLFPRMGELWKRGQEARGARAGLAGLAGSFQCALPLQIIVTPAQPELHPSVQRHQELCPVAKAGGHSLGLRIRRHISALAYSQDNFLEANGVSRVPLRSQELQASYDRED